MPENIEKITNAYQKKIQAYLEQNCFVDPQAPQQLLFEAMRYSLLAGGKRLRPLLTLEFCRMTCGDPDRALPLAAAVEMVHTYSLIHDDLPCMDNDDFRRGMPTNHKVYGEAMAVLAGDGLLTAAFSFIAQAELPAQVRIRAVQVLSKCAGELGMVGGQVLDMQSQARQCTRQEVTDIQSRKTGALIQAACVLGVLAGDGTEEMVEAASRFAQDLGLAFQIRDDILDVIGTREQMGKSVGTDGEKNTFVQLYGLENCQNMVRQLTETAIDRLKTFPDSQYMVSLAKRLTDRYQ